MTSVDIVSELAHTCQQRPVMTRLQALGVPRPVLTTPLGIDGLFGVSRVRTYQDGSYEPAEDGVGAIIIAVIEHDELSDLLAFCTTDPSRWWLRLGLAVYLGEEHADYAALLHEPLRLFNSPLSWLRAGCDGAVVLDWRFGPSSLFEVSEIVTEDLQHGEQVEQRLRELDPAFPRVTIPRAA